MPRRTITTHNRICLAVLVAGLFAVTGCTPYYNDVDAFMMEPRPLTLGLPYTLGVGDSFNVTCAQAKEVNGQYSIKPNGTVLMPLLGRLYVVGMTSQQIAELVRQKTLQYYKEAEVIVEITGYTSKFYYVFGEGAGGPRSWTGRETLFHTLAELNPSKNVDLNRIFVMRPSPDGRSVRKMSVSFGEWQKTGLIDRNALIAPNDIIYFPPTPVTWTENFVSELLRPIAPVMTLLRTPANIKDNIEDISDTYRGYHRSFGNNN